MPNEEMTIEEVEYQHRRSMLRSIVRGAYDIQKLRVALGNRIIIAYKSKMGIDGGVKKDGSVTKEDKDDKVLKEIKRDYKRIADGIANKKSEKAAFAKIEKTGVISTYTEYCLIDQYFDLLGKEESHFRRLGTILGEFPIWNDFLKDVKGVGPAMAGVMLSEFDIHKAKYVSSLWMYAGLDVASDGRGRSKRKEHLIPKTYRNAMGEETETVGITYNPFLKTKLMGVLADSFIRTGSPYRKIYDDYKHRLESNPNHIDKTPGHRNNMAKRYMIKIFLCDLYAEWKKVEGLPAHVPYHEAKLGLHHGKAS